jgi:hypothetical protein
MQKSIGELNAKFNEMFKSTSDDVKCRNGFIKCGVKYFEEKKVQKGFVYFIQDQLTGLIKIGWAFCPDVRISKLQTGSAGKLVILGAFEGTIKDEKYHQQLMKSEHFRGEWFSDSENIKQYIKEKNTYLK